MCNFRSSYLTLSAVRLSNFRSFNKNFLSHVKDVSQQVWLVIHSNNSIQVDLSCFESPGRSIEEEPVRLRRFELFYRLTGERKEELTAVVFKNKKKTTAKRI